MSHHPCLQRVWVSQSLITVPFFHDTRKPLPHWHLGNQNWSPGFWLPFRGCLFLLCTSVYLEGATGKGGWGLAESLSLGSLIYLGPQLTGQVWAAFLDRGEYLPNGRSLHYGPVAQGFSVLAWCGLQNESTAGSAGAVSRARASASGLASWLPPPWASLPISFLL